jgi:hypothetical protein
MLIFEFPNNSPSPAWMHRLLFFRKQIDIAARQPSSAGNSGQLSLEMQYNNNAVEDGNTNPWGFSSTASKNVGSLYSDLENKQIQFNSSELRPGLRGTVDLKEDDIIEDVDSDLSD